LNTRVNQSEYSCCRLDFDGLSA